MLQFLSLPIYTFHQGQFIGAPMLAATATLAGGWQWTWVATGMLCIVGWWAANRIGRKFELKTIAG